MVAEFEIDLIENTLWIDNQTTGVVCTPRVGRGASRLGQRAVVIGAGMGGLSAAGALAPYFEQIEILKAELEGETSPKSGPRQP